MMDPVETSPAKSCVPGRWAPLATIREQQDEPATQAATQFTVQRQWPEEFGGYNGIRLAHAGRRTSATGDEAHDLRAGDAMAPVAETKAA